MEYMLDKHLMRKLGGSLEEDLDVVLTLVDRDGMKPGLNDETTCSASSHKSKGKLAGVPVY